MTDANSSIVLGFGLNTWDGYWQTRQHVLSRLAARGWSVGYTTPAMSVWERQAQRWIHARWRSQRLRLDGVEVHYPGRLPALTHRSESLDRAIMRRQARAFADQVRSGPARRTIAYVFHPLFVPYLEALEPCAVVYHADDNFGAVAPGDSVTGELERELVQRADRIFTITGRLAERLGPSAATKTRILPNGADVEAFRGGADRAVPADLAALPRPRIGYAGSLNAKVDFALIARLARARPSVHWALIGRMYGPGGQSDSCRAGFEECRVLPNVRFLGEKHHGELPAYCAHVDANAMFYRTDGEGWWRDIYPLKLHECLATGQPLLSADTPAVREFREVVAICRDDAEWLAAVDAVVAGQGTGLPADRIAVARANSWDVRLDVVENALRELT